MTITQIGTAVGILIGVSSLAAGLYTYHDNLATDPEVQIIEDLIRRDMHLSFVDLRIKVLETKMEPFEDKGLFNLGPHELKKYNRFKEKLEEFEKVRSNLSGFE